MTDHSENTTKLFGPLRSDLMDALRAKDWPRAEQIAADMQRELLSLQCLLIVQKFNVPTNVYAASIAEIRGYLPQFKGVAHE